MIHEWRRDAYTISTDPQRVDVELIHQYLSTQTYWATGRPREVVARSLEHSLCFGLYHDAAQVGFGRVITDYATFAWLADVFVLAEHQGQGLGTWLTEVIITHPQLQGFRRWALATKDAQALYGKFGFAELKRPERWMERRDPATLETPDYWAGEPSST
ncbi:MAG: GNAT family N-acetyltransferase [Acidobacteria bacterium]|nr:GNAT family N-acetyltransferase [Acidobacteriota bacterium]MBI3421508.1 GNAT family N-acetyltransferase [Acidobacteriota bacterium]